MFWEDEGGSGLWVGAVFVFLLLLVLVFVCAVLIIHCFISSEGERTNLGGRNLTVFIEKFCSGCKWYFA